MTESHHLADIVNQADLARISTPMPTLSRTSAVFTVSPTSAAVNHGKENPLDVRPMLP